MKFYPNEPKFNSTGLDCQVYSKYKWSKKKPYKKTKKIPVEKTVYEFTPSKTGGGKSVKRLGGVASSKAQPKNLKKLYMEALAIKKHLKTHINSHDSKFLLNCVVTVLRLVAHFSRDSKDLPFDWKTKKFLPPHKKSSMIPYQDVQKLKEIAKQKAKEEQSRLESEVNSKTKNDVCVTIEVGMVEPIKDPNCITLSALKRLVARATPTPLVDPLLVKGHAWIPPPLKCPETYVLFLNREEKKIWLKFKNLDKGTPEVINVNVIEEEKKTIELDHPIVSVIGNFAVAAFNKACEMHVKKDEHNNLHDFEVMECKYLKIPKAYYFYMTIEAIEEGNLGVYETKVVCSSDECRITLTKFVLTDRTPAGTKAMAISFFSCLRSICQSLEGIVTYKVDRLEAIRRYLKGRGKANTEITRLTVLEHETMRGLREVLSLGPPLLFPRDCIRTTNKDGWSHPDDYYSGMVRRVTTTTNHFAWSGEETIYLQSATSVF